MVAAAKKTEPVLVTGWYGYDQQPVHVGPYEVRNNPEVDAPHFMILDSSVDVCVRWWDGFEWLTKKGGNTSIMDLHPSHQWRGRRMWVLVRRADPFMSAMAGAPVDVYLISARPRHAKWGGLAGARPFKTERAAQRFAARYSHLGLTAVLP